MDALPTYAMGAMELPPAHIRAIDGLRRAFHWNVAYRPSSAKCLVAWDVVYRPKSETERLLAYAFFYKGDILTSKRYQLHSVSALT